MKIYNQAILCALVAMTLGACSEDNPWAVGRGQGTIDLKLSASADVKDAIPVTRAGAPELVAPDPADFAISLLNVESGQTQTWPTLADFNDERSFEVGVYTLTASYGDPHECGFDKPYFMGEANVNVMEERQSSVEVKAQLANSMLSIDYTDAFKEYFPEYAVAAHTVGETTVNFSKDETRAAFLTPGEVILEVALVKPGGQAARVQAATFPAAARHHYHVTFNVDADPVGTASLVVTFDDSLTQEDVTISLSDELFTSEGPQLTAEGFTDGVTVEALAGNMSETPLKFNAVCKSGIKSAVLTVSGNVTPSFGNEVELVGASEETQAELERNEIKVIGFYKDPQEMGVVDLTSLSRHLSQGNYTITLRVTDNLGRVSEPVSLVLSTKPVVLRVIEGSAIYSYAGSDITTTSRTVDATILVSYNGINPEKNITFQNRCRAGVFKDCEVVSIVESTRTRAFEEKTYICNIRLCDAETSPMPMKMFFAGQQWGEEFTIDVIEPEFTLEADPHATYCVFRVNADDPTLVPTITNGLTIYRNKQAVVEDRIRVDAEAGLITLLDLTDDRDYTIGYSLTSKDDKSEFVIHTERAVQIPNSGFTETERTIDMTNINAGGEWKYLRNSNQRNRSSIVVNTPKSWATLNPLTCWTGAANVNTWFCVPSTLIDKDNNVVVRTVKYDHNGTEPELDSHGGSMTLYSRNSPKSFAAQSSGELFLGTYSYDGAAHRSDGIEFTTRPTLLTFTYEYVSESGEVGEVYIAVVDVQGHVIVENSAEITGGSTSQTVALPPYPFGVKAAGIRVSFKSSKNIINIPVPSGDALKDVGSTAIAWEVKSQTIPPNEYKSLCVGSQLKLKQVRLNY